MTANEIKNIFAKYKLKPNKLLGQNFLIDQNALTRIVKEGEITKDDTILEVGPGLGVLTKELVKAAGRVVAVEKDRELAEILKKELADFKNLEIAEGDILKTNLSDYNLKANNYKLIANIPYYLTSHLIRAFLEGESPKEIILLIQKEVAERICAAPPKMSLLAVSVQFYADAAIIAPVSKNSFWPAPKVDSAIVKITPKDKNRPLANLADFFSIVHAGFSHPRKQLAGNLSQALKINRQEVENVLKSFSFDPKQRAETLSIEDWIRLSEKFSTGDLSGSRD